jgi:hypothetical protein
LEGQIFVATNSLRLWAKAREVAMHRRALEFVVKWGRNCLREASTCRECDHSVQLFDEFCPHCGAGHPSRIRMPTVIVLAMPILLVLVYACI